MSPLSALIQLDRPSNIGVMDSCKLFAGLPPIERGRLAGHSFMAYAERGETIWTQGSPSSFLAIVGTGSIRLTMTDPDKGEHDIGKVGPGGCLGLEALCGGKTHQSNAIAVDTTWYLKVPCRAVIEALTKGKSSQ
jgi:CRP-like cAMP-binding protein